MEVATLQQLTVDDSIMQAHVESRDVIEFVYPSSKGGGPVRRTLSPWELQGRSVIGWDHGREAVRRYIIERIEGGTAVVLDAEYVDPA